MVQWCPHTKQKLSIFKKMLVIMHQKQPGVKQTNTIYSMHYGTQN